MQYLHIINNNHQMHRNVLSGLYTNVLHRYYKVVNRIH